MTRALVSWMRSWPIRRKLLAALAAASALPILVGAAITLQVGGSLEAAEGEQHLAGAADSIAHALDGIHSGNLASVQRIARTPDLVHYLLGPDPAGAGARALAAEDLSAWGSDAQIRGSAIAGLDGVVLAATEPSLVGRSLADHAEVREAIAGRVAVSDVYVSPPETGSTPTVAYAAPITDSGRPLGVALLFARMSAFWDIVKAGDALAGEGSFSLLVDRDGIRIAHSHRPDYVFRPTGPLDAAMVERLVAERRFGEETRALVGAPIPCAAQLERSRGGGPYDTARVYAPANDAWNMQIARPLRLAPWTLFYLVPEESFTAPVRALVGRGLLASGALLGLALLLAAIGSRRIAAPIQGIAAAADRVGGGDLSVRLAEPDGDEIGTLARTFNHMAESLAASRAEAEARARERAAAHETLSIQAEELRAQKAELIAQQAQIREAKDELDQFFGLAIGILAIIDFEGRLRRLNPAWETLLGYKLEEITGRPFIDFVHSDDRERTQVEAARLQEGARTVAFENRYRHKDGSWRWLLWTAAPSIERKLIYCSASDITDRKRAETELREKSVELERANRLKSEFLANMSHELRTPLNAILGFSGVLLEQARERLTPAHLGHLEEIRSGGKHLLEMIDDVLDLAKIEAGRMSFEPTAVAPAAAIAEARGLVAPLAERKRISVRAVVETAAAVRADPRSLRQMLLNLLSNAVKFSEAGTSVEVGAALEGGHVRFRVRDEGPGIDPAVVERLFEPFVQGEGALVKRHGGTGLGLAITRRLALQHGGTISVDTAPGRGATFSFTIPLLEGTAAGAPSPGTGSARPGDVEAPARPSPLVLVVDDDGLARQTLRAVLQPKGYRVAIASTGEEALSLARREPPALAIVDLHLPDIPGTEVIARLAAAEGTRECPVIVITAADLSPAERAALGERVVSVAPKGDLTAGDLLAGIARHAPVGPPMTPAPPPPPPAAAPSRAARLLVVDDHDFNRELVRAILEPQGYAVATAHDGETGVAAAARERPDLVLLDLAMPGMDGFATLARLRADPRLDAVPIVALTALAMRGDEERALAAGFDGYVTKPIEPLTFGGIVAGLLARGRRRPGGG